MWQTEPHPWRPVTWKERPVHTTLGLHSLCYIQVHSLWLGVGWGGGGKCIHSSINYSLKVPTPGGKNCPLPSKPSYSGHCCLREMMSQSPRLVGQQSTSMDAPGAPYILSGSLSSRGVLQEVGKTESYQSRCYLSLALACLAAATGTLLDCIPGGCKAPLCQPQVASTGTPSSPVTPLSSLFVNTWLFYLFLLPLLHVWLKAKTPTQAFMYIKIGLWILTSK